MTNTFAEKLKKELEVSLLAGEFVGAIYDALLEQYKDKESDEILKNLNVLCVRLVFCLYAEDSGILGKKDMFHNYMRQFPAYMWQEKLRELFLVLNTKKSERHTIDPDMDPALAAFPYVNGGLFAELDVEIPTFTDGIVALILDRSKKPFDWSLISPTIFSALFESTLNPEARRSGGMHFTSIENIHKVIDPLFLDDLTHELEEIAAIKSHKVRKEKLEQYQNKLASLRFLDPACGSGNFLTETYICLRRLENKAIELMQGDGQIKFLFGDVIKVSIHQFYGIEVNDFAIRVGMTSLWIAELQMMKETVNIIHMGLDYLPLKSYANIIEGNALHMDWEEVISKEKLHYIMGNPPFVGARLMNLAQKDDMVQVFGKFKNVGNLDYVSCWYKKATEFMKNTDIRTALVGTNSITQGEQVATLWKHLYEEGARIDFAHRTFRWDSEASFKANVHCVIIGFHVGESSDKKKLFTDGKVQLVDNINSYLIEAPDVFIESRKQPLCKVPAVVFGSMPNDGGFLSDFSTVEKEGILMRYPEAEYMFKKYLGATEFLRNKERWCLWLKDILPEELQAVPPVWEAVCSTKALREGSNRDATRKLAETPGLFGEIRQPEDMYILIPRHSSQNRNYIPMGFMAPDVICGDANLLMPDATLYEFGIMSSGVHNAWVRTVCGRIKSDFRYSVNVVYNNFPWPKITDDQKREIEQTAQKILEARAMYKDASLADLYDPQNMPAELIEAHKANDAAVMKAYGFGGDDWNEAKCVAELMKLYREYQV